VSTPRKPFLVADISFQPAEKTSAQNPREDQHCDRQRALVVWRIFRNSNSSASSRLSFNICAPVPN
jgi:hypothetical protein